MPTTVASPALRNAYRVSIAMFLLLLGGAIVLYKQRMLFVDPTYVTYGILQKNGLVISEHRYGAFITQMVPLLCLRLHLSLRAILLCYSASFYVFYVLVAIIVGHFQRKSEFAILLGLYFTLIVSDVYFWPNNEVHQGVAWMILFLGCFFRQHEKKHIPLGLHPVLLAISFLAIFSHFLVILPLSYLWAYILLADSRYTDSRRKNITVAVYSVWILGVFGVRFWLSQSSSYDGEKLGTVSHLKFSTVFHAFVGGQAHSFLKLMLRNYWLLIPIFIAGQIVLLRQRKYRLSALTLVYGGGYFVLICITYDYAFGRELRFYMESEWMALAIIIAAPLVISCLPQVNHTAMATAVISLIYAVRLMYIYSSYQYFDARLKRIDAITSSLHRMGIYKAILVAKKDRSEQLFIMDWGIPMESLMLTQLQGACPQITFKVVDESFKLQQPSDSTFWSCFGPDPVKTMNARYFVIDTGNYILLPLETIMNRKNISVKE